MATLISLAIAKKHLGVTTSDRDGDILMKLTQAESIVLDYLKVRSIAIASISVANPTVITTILPHSLTTGATATITDTTTTPTVNGAQVVTVTGASTFTVPVDVAIGQADAAGMVAHSAWSEASVPGQVQASILLVLTNLVEFRGDGTKDEFPAISPNVESLLMRSRDPALA